MFGVEASIEMSIMTQHSVAVVPTWGGHRHLERFLPTLLHQVYPFARVLVVGDARELVGPGVEVLVQPENQGFSGAVNRGIEAALADPAVEFIAVVNDDVGLDPNWHARALEAIEARAEYGSCATCLLQLENPDRVASAGIEWHEDGFASEGLNGETPPEDSTPREVWGASGAAALFRRTLFEDVGLFDERFFAYQEDVELALRARSAGWRCVLAPAALGVHLGFGSNRPFPLGGTRADYFNARNRIVLLVKSLPGEDWRRHLRVITAAHLKRAASAVREGRAAAVWAGTLHGLLRVPSALKARRATTLRRATGRNGP